VSGTNHLTAHAEHKKASEKSEALETLLAIKPLFNIH